MFQNKKVLSADVQIKTLKKYALWIIVKYIIDSHHKQINSSRNDLLGGFMDRWINRIPESLIFKELLDKEDFDVVNDDFFYINESAKNAPDVLGLVKEDADNNKVFYPFYIFDVNSWSKYDEDAPFIEMKTSRNTQKLATISKRQDDSDIDDNYYILVESEINDDYLLYLLNDEIFFNKYNFDSNSKFSKQDRNTNIKNAGEVIEYEVSRLIDNGIISNDKINDGKIVGNFQLCGIFKGSTIKEYATLVGVDEETKDSICPRYLTDIYEIYDYEDYYSDSFELDYYSNTINSIPFFIDVPNNVNVYVEDEKDDHIIISTDGKVKILDFENNVLKEIDNGFHKLKFESFISNLYKYYYLDYIKELDSPIVDLKYNGLKLESGVCNFYGDDFRNNKFNLEKYFQSDFEIYKCSKSSIEFFSEECDGYRLKFKNSGEKDGSPIPLDKSNKNDIYYYYDENNDSHLNLKINIKDNSKLRFIKKNKTNMVIFIDGEAEICDLNKNKKFHIKNNIYDIKIGESSSKNIDNKFYIRKFNDKTIINDPDIKKDIDLVLNSENFYIPDDDINNVKVKFDLIDNPEIKIVDYKKNDQGVYSSFLITINGKAEVNGFPIEDDEKNVFRRKWKLKFGDFDRNMKNEEYVLSKNAIISSNKSCEKELINIFKEYISKLEQNNRVLIENKK